MSATPTHYNPTGAGPTPWDLQKVMLSSGSAFVDARRTDAIEYCFRMKGNLLGDLRKARHCLDQAIAHLRDLMPKCRTCGGDGQVEIQSGPHMRECGDCKGGGLATPTHPDKP